MFNKIYHCIQQCLSWWQYAPKDEREKQIFMEAYRRSFFTLIVSIFILLVPMDFYIDEQYANIFPTKLSLYYTFEITLLIMALLAVIIGSTAFYKQDVDFKKLSNLSKFSQYFFVLLDFLIIVLLWFLFR